MDPDLKVLIFCALNGDEVAADKVRELIAEVFE